MSSKGKILKEGLFTGITTFNIIMFAKGRQKGFI